MVKEVIQGGGDFAGTAPNGCLTSHSNDVTNHSRPGEAALMLKALIEGLPGLILGLFFVLMAFVVGR